MTQNPIEAILFDMGGTLRHTTPLSPAEKRDRIRQIGELIGYDAPVEVLETRLAERALAYKQWSHETLIELNEPELWTRWMMPDMPAERVSDFAVQMNELYRESMGLKTFYPESEAVVIELFRRGYRLGIVSNTTSTVEVPAELAKHKLGGYFETVVLSAAAGMRKPAPALLHAATSEMEIDPVKCAYIGDRIDRDVAASRSGGFGKTIILGSGWGKDSEVDLDAEMQPDHFIQNLNDLLKIFPPRPAPTPNQVYDASLSTMWALQNFHCLTDFLEQARRLGFARCELNHQIDSKILTGLDYRRYSFSSVHAPCPADVSDEELRKADFLVSSTNEDRRRLGVSSVQRSIDLAHQAGAKYIVIHAGQIDNDKKAESKLRALLKAAKQDSEEYRQLWQRMVQDRAELAGPHLQAVKKSMRELLDYAGAVNIRLGIESRYHFMEIPSPDELEELLALGTPDQLGFILDVGHVQTLAKLGFYPVEEWLRRFGPRIIAMHLHDTQGTTDHFAAGRGEIDFNLITPYLPADAYRVCEFQTFNSTRQVKDGLLFLHEKGIIQCQ